MKVRHSRVRFRLVARLLSGFFLLGWPLNSWAAWPLSSSAQPQEYADPANWPTDPGYGNQWYLYGFSLGRGPLGASVDRAWSVTQGSGRVTLAFLNAGIDWSEKDLAVAWALSRGELPPPLGVGGPLSPGPDPHDANGDGRFDVRDYTSASRGTFPTLETVIDPRLLARTDRGDSNGNGVLDPQDLMRVFSNGVDDDQNGYVDDVCGWDFVGDQNDAAGSPHSGGADTSDLVNAVALTNNGFGQAGVCPECLAMPLRVGGPGAADPTSVARALLYSQAAGARVAVVSPQAFGQTRFLKESLASVQRAGLTVVAATSDLPSGRTDWPSGADGVIAAQPLSLEGTSWQSATHGSNPKRCGAFGGTTRLAVPTDRCGRGAASLLGGVVGLLESKAALGGLSPPLGPSEITGLLAISSEKALGRAGWERAVGFGRVDARGALDLLEAGRIPASLEFVTPASFAQVSDAPFSVTVSASARAPFDLFLEAAGGEDPPDEAFVPFGHTQASAAWMGELGPVAPAVVKLYPDPAEGEGQLAVSLRLRAVVHYPDGRGEVISEKRRIVFPVPADPNLVFGFPIDLGGSGNSSPRLVSLDAEGDDQLVVADAEGRVHVFQADGKERPNFPVALSTRRRVAEVPDGGVSPGPSVQAAVAVADVNSDGRRELVVCTSEGELHVLSGSGEELFGFPQVLERAPQSEEAFLAAPVVAPSPEGPLILQAGGSGILHAFHGDGSPFLGFPFHLGRTADGGTADRPRILGTPAVGDFDRDGWPEIAVGTTELVGGTGAGRAYLLSVTPQGVSLAPGWPQELPSAPTLPESEAGSGVAASPVIADFDRDRNLEVAFRGAEAPWRIFDGAGAVVLELESLGGKGPLTQAAIADLDRDRLLELVDVDRAEPSASGTLSAWAAGAQLRRNRDLTDAPAPLAIPPAKVREFAQSGIAVADVTGEGDPDLIFPDGRFLDAYDTDGERPRGWPKLTAGWIASTPAVGVVNQRLAVAAVTREGLLYLWSVSGFPENIHWDGFHHDPANTGNYSTPLPARHIEGIGVKNPRLRTGCCSEALTPAELSGGLLLWAAVARRSRRRASG